MKPQISPRDRVLLSQYLDRQLKPDDQARLESRLAKEAALSAALEDLRKTRSILRSTPRLRAPRNFILSQSQVPVRTAYRFTLPLGWVSAAASLALILVLAGDLFGFFSPSRLARESLYAVKESKALSEQAPVSQPESADRMVPTETLSLEMEKVGEAEGLADSLPTIAGAAPATVEDRQAKEAPPSAEAAELATALSLEQSYNNLPASSGISGTGTLTSTVILEVQAPIGTPQSTPVGDADLPTATVAPTQAARVVEGPSSGELSESAQEAEILPLVEPTAEMPRDEAPAAGWRSLLSSGRWILWTIEILLALVAIAAGVGAILLRRKASA